MATQRRFDEQRFFILNDSTIRLSPALACEIGFNESIIFLQLEFLISIRGEERDGLKWLRMSIADLESVFPFWSSATINRAIKTLEERRLIFVGNYNRHAYDKTRWLAINLEAASELSSIAVKVTTEQFSRSQAYRFEHENDGGDAAQNGARHETPPFHFERANDADPLQNETRSTQNERGLNQNETGSTQNETTIHREVLKRGIRENTHTESAGSLFEQTGDERVCVSNNLTFENYRDYARATAGFSNPDAWALKTFDKRTPETDSLVREWLQRESAGSHATAQRAETSTGSLLNFRQAAQRVAGMVKPGDNPTPAINSLTVSDDVRRQLFERFMHEPTELAGGDK
jgi:hypothetical protein